jgi:hypothetical protein
MNPESILKSVREKYLSLKSYADEGVVGTSKGKRSLEFKTYFASPLKVRFEWRTSFPPTENAIWTNGTESHSWFMGKLELLPEFSSGIAGATGVSSASVVMILKLLLPDCIEVRSAWYDMQDMNMDEEPVDALMCYHIIGTDRKTDDTEAWISKDDFLVRRLRRRTEISQEESERMLAEARKHLEDIGLPQGDLPVRSIPAQKFTDEYNYREVKINQPIADEIFEFDPSRKET